MKVYLEAKSIWIEIEKSWLNLLPDIISDCFGRDANELGKTMIIEENGLYGYIRPDFTICQTPVFKKAHPFTGNCAIVESNEIDDPDSDSSRFGILDIGMTVRWLSNDYDEISPINHGLFLVSSIANGGDDLKSMRPIGSIRMQGILDEFGKEVVPCAFSSIARVDGSMRFFEVQNSNVKHLFDAESVQLSKRSFDSFEIHDDRLIVGYHSKVLNHWLDQVSKEYEYETQTSKCYYDADASFKEITEFEFTQLLKKQNWDGL